MSAIRAYIIMPDGERIGPYTTRTVHGVRLVRSAKIGQLLDVEYDVNSRCEWCATADGTVYRAADGDDAVCADCRTLALA